MYAWLSALIPYSSSCWAEPSRVRSSKSQLLSAKMWRFQEVPL
jgi:hypothetical protein